MCNNQCNCCNNLLYTSSITSTPTAVSINFPEQSVCNNDKICFVITTTIPVSATPLPVSLAFGGTVFKLVNQYSNYVYSDQLRSRKVYCVSLKTDSLLAKNLKCNLCPTAFDLPCLPATPAPAVVLSKEVNK